jgi:hypothetical protein
MGTTSALSVPSVDYRSVGCGMPGGPAAQRLWSTSWSASAINTIMTMQRALLILEAEVGIQSIDLVEASVRRPPRSSVYVATYTAHDGGQITRSTGQRDYRAAMGVAKEWEKEARREREAAKAAGVVTPVTGKLSLGLTQREVAALLRISERTVRNTERRAIMKLSRHPLLKAIWKEFTESRSSTEIGPDWDSQVLSAEEKAALLGLARSPLELQALRRVLAFVCRTPQTR